MLVIVLVHAPALPVTVYTLVEEGFPVTIEPVVELKPDDQVYDVAPVAVNVAVPPAQIVALFTETEAFGITDKVMVVEYVWGKIQAPALPVKSV